MNFRGDYRHLVRFGIGRVRAFFIAWRRYRLQAAVVRIRKRRQL